MRTKAFATATILVAAVLGGCETMPSGPTVAILPTPGKPLDLFQQEDMACRDYATRALGPNAQYAANDQFATSAAVGAALGAVIGGLAGGRNGAGGGAAFGLAAGSMVGAGQAQNTAYSLQQRYDIAYAQCMYSKGNQLPPPPPRVRVYHPYYYGP